MHLSTSGYHRVDAKVSGQPEEMLKGSLQWTSSNNTSRLEVGIALVLHAQLHAVFTVAELSIQFGYFFHH